jgi:hypothetical protein
MTGYHGVRRKREGSKNKRINENSKLSPSLSEVSKGQRECHYKCTPESFAEVIVPDPGKGECADPVNGGAILGKGGSDPRGGNKERQLSPDKGRYKT